MKERTYNLRELCREADVTERTVRYYIKEGLLPPPHGSGPFSRYGYEHWLRLQFIKRLKDEYLPLSEIKNLLDSRSTAELDQLARQSGLIPAGEAANEGPLLATAQASDPLRAFIDGGSGRARLLREQMASWPVAQDEDEPVPEAAPHISPASFEASNFSATFVPGPNLNRSEEDELWGSGEFGPEDEPDAPVEPPPLYAPPIAASKAFPAQPFRAGTPGGGAPGAPMPSMPPVPPAAANRPAPAPAAPLSAMKMSRFAAQAKAAPASEAAPDLAGGAVPPEPPVPIPAPIFSPMSMPRPESSKAPETVTGQTWERIEVAPGVELHIEKRIADTHRPALANLLQAARRLFGQKEI